MSKNVEIKFVTCLEDGELYTTSGFPVKQFIRKVNQGEKTVWVTAQKKEEKYAEGAPVKPDTIMRVIKGEKAEKTVLFEEHLIAEDDSVYAEMKSPAAKTLILDAAAGVFKSRRLKTKENWISWLLNDTAKYHYVGSTENWLYFGTDETNREVLEEVDIYGVRYTVEASTRKHKVSDKTWTVVEIVDKDGKVAELCGYQFH